MLIRSLTFLICCLVAVPGSAGDGLWEWVTPTPQGHDLFAAAIGDGVTVAVGRGGTAITCPDGGEWRTSHVADGYSLTDVVWANGLFVAVGGAVGFEFSPGLGVVLTSEDGMNWVERHREDYLSLEAVVWAGSRFVAVGIGGGVLLSPDGLSWSEHDLELDRSWTMTDIAWNGTRLTAVGYDNVFGFGFPAYFTSENGDTWHAQNFECERCDPQSIAAVGGRFVAMGSSGKALVSDDGLTWAEAPIDSDTDLEVIVGAGDRFKAIGGNVVGTSLDGYVWTIDELPTESRVHGLAWSGGGYLAVGEDGYMMSSPDGSLWNQLSFKSFDLSASREINELATNGSTIVGVGEGGVIITGRHGTEWVRRSSPAEYELNSVIWAGSAFWTVGSYGVFRSIDGVHWAQILLDYDIGLFDIVWNGSLFVAVGRHSIFVDAVVETHEIVLTSMDGTEWSYQHFDLEWHLRTVGWTGSLFVVAGDGQQFMTSADGFGWQQHPQPDGVTLKDMAWDGSRLVAVGWRAGGGGAVLITDGGIEWAEAALPEIVTASFDDVTWTGTHFVAVSRGSGDVVFTSTDGLTWASETTDTAVWPVSAVGDQRSLYLTGRGLKIIRRTEPLQGVADPRRPTARVLPGVDANRAEQHLLPE